MHKLKLLLLSITAAVLCACGGGSDDTLTGGSGVTPGTPVPSPVGTLTLLTSSPQVPSDGSANATITALVRDANNNVMEDVAVTFAATSGSLAVTQPATTNENGVLTAVLNTAGDPTNRAITITGTAIGTTSNKTATVTVNVIGTKLILGGPTSLPIGGTESYSVVLTNAGDVGIANIPVTITSSGANGISRTPITTDASGAASFTLTANSAVNDTLTASALGIQASQLVSVSADQFRFTVPAAATEVALGSNAVVTVNWSSGGPMAGRQITFSTTRGTLSPATIFTDGAGNATVTVAATNAGPAVLTATNDVGTSIQRTVEFVATVPATLELQADPFTIPTNDQSAITAIVSDANGNLVKNRIVSFVLADVTGGSLSVAQATTNSQGRAQTFYKASPSTSSVDGVHIDASVVGSPGVTDRVNLTVAQRELFISIGTGNEIFEPNTAQYRKEWVVQVTDAQGNGVDLVPVSLSVLSQRYWEGRRAYIDPPGFWSTRPGTEAQPLIGCVDEDADQDGVLDTVPPEDTNGNGRLEAGNIVTAVAQKNGGSTITTDVNGFALVDVYYPQEFAYWLEVTLEARTSVQGTEFARSTTFVLEGLSSDFSTETTPPPGLNSPFGVDGNCATPPPL